MAVDEAGAEDSFYILYIIPCIFRGYDVFYDAICIGDQYLVVYDFTAGKQFTGAKLLVHQISFKQRKVKLVLWLIGNKGI